MFKFFYAIIFVFFVAGCSESPKNTVIISPPARIDPASPIVTGMGKSDKAVATVNGVPIPASRLKWAMDNAPDDMKGIGKKEMLHLLVLEEVLFQKAVAAGFYNPLDPGLGDEFRRVLALQFLQKYFVEDYPPSAITMQDLQPLYNLNIVKAKYDHKDIYRVYDMQWICCLHPDCQAEQCYKQGKVLMQDVYDRIRKEKFTKDEIVDIVRSMRSIAPKLAMQKYAFVYDWEKHLQKGRTIFDDNVVNAVIKLKPGTFSTPTRSGYGWHILYLWKHEPEQHLGLWAPYVQNDLRHFFYEKFQSNRFRQFLFHRLPWKEFDVLRRMVIPTLRTGRTVHQDPSGLYSIKIFNSAIEMSGSQDSSLIQGM